MEIKKHLHKHNHSHSHHHDHETNELTLNEKLKSLLQHWIDHNISHQESYHSWSKKAEEENLFKVVECLKDVSSLTDEINNKLKEAMNDLA